MVTPKPFYRYCLKRMLYHFPTITANNAEQHALESARQYSEAFSLAFAQQLKNKDIPEGGSKAVCLVRRGKYSNG